MLYWQLSFLKFSILFLLGINHSILAQTVSDIFPEEYRQKIDSAVLRNAVDRPALQATIEWIKQLAQSTQDPVILAELARLECANAEVETQTSKRLAFYKNCIDTADQALAENANEVVALYWKAVAMGKLSEKMSILDALRMTRSMENLFLRVIALDENYDNAGGHKALGRIYHQLPGFRSVLEIMKRRYFILEEHTSYFRKTSLRGLFMLKFLWISTKNKKHYGMQNLF